MESIGKCLCVTVPWLGDVIRQPRTNIPVAKLLFSTINVTTAQHCSHIDQLTPFCRPVECTPSLLRPRPSPPSPVPHVSFPLLPSRPHFGKMHVMDVPGVVWRSRSPKSRAARAHFGSISDSVWSAVAFQGVAAH